MRFYKRISVFALALCLLLPAFPAVGFAQDARTGAGYDGAGDIAEDTAYVPGELIVVFNEDVSARAAERVIDAADGALSELLDAPDEDAVAALVELPADAEMRAAIEEFSQNSLVDFVQPNYIYELADAEISPAFSSNDEQVSLQWHLDSIDVAGAWSEIAKYGSKPAVRVAVIDNNVYTAHEDLDDNVDTALARDFRNGTEQNPRSDYYGAHGTHVAGIIGAEANNGRGGVGVAAGANNNIAEIVPINVFPSGEGGPSSTVLASAIRYAVAADVDVINMSLGYSANTPDRYLETEVSNAIANGVAVVCAAGNDGEMTPPTWPGDFNIAGVVSVVNIDSDNNRNTTSNYGVLKDISAPGTAIFSTSTTRTGDNAYAGASGTSMSAPVVAGVAAMMLYVNDGLSPAQVEDILKKTATPLSDPTATGGKVNAAAAVRAAAQGTSLGGTVSVSGASGANGAPRYTDTLTVNTAGLSANPGTLSYQWKRGDAAIVGANGASYTVGIADIGQSLSVTVTAQNFTGGVTSAATPLVEKAPAPAIAWPTATPITYGASLSDSALQGGSAHGSFAWTDPTTVPSAGTGFYSVTFTPSADALLGYTGIAGSTQAVSLTVNKAAAPSDVQNLQRTFYVKAGTAMDYSFDLTSLTPDLAGLQEGLSYAASTVENNESVLDTLNYSSGNTLTLPVSLSSANGKTAKVKVTIKSRNYNDFDAYIIVTAMTKEVLNITDLSAVTYPYTYDESKKAGYTGTPSFVQEGGGAVSPSNSTLTAYYTGVLSNGQSYTDHTTSPSAAGAYTLRLTLENDSNYYAEKTFHFSIAKANPAAPSPSPSVSAVYGDSLRDVSLQGGFSWKTPDTPVGDVSAAAVPFPALYTPDANNYNTVDANVPVTVNPRPLTVADLAAASRAYDGTTAVSTVGGRLDGLVPGDEGRVGFTIAGGAAASKLPGTHAVSGVAVTLTGDRAFNYGLQSLSAITAVIGQKQIWAEDVAVTAPSKVYDGTDAASLQASFKSGVVVSGDDLRIALTGRYADANVGSGKRVIVEGWTLEGADARNYVLDGPLPSGVTGTVSSSSPSLSGGGGGGGGGGSSTVTEEKREEETRDDAEQKAEQGSAAASSGSEWVNPFADVDESTWYYGDVEYAVTRGLFTGTSAASFSPNEAMTRGMLVTVLGRLCGADVSGYASGAFDDVAADVYYAPYIAWAAENGLVNGTGNGAFSPDAEITRQDLALIFLRCANFRGDVLPETRTFVPFADEAAISDYAKEATQRLFEAGLISGKPGNAFDPKGKATRAEVAAVLHRYLESVEI